MPPIGRPRSERATRGVRMYEDTAEKIMWITKLEEAGESAADFIEDHIREAVDARYEPFAERVKRIKEAIAGHSEGGET